MSGVPFRTRKPLLDSDAREELESMLKEIKEIPLSLSAILSDTWTQWRESCDQPVDLRLLLPTYTQSISTISLAILHDQLYAQYGTYRILRGEAAGSTCLMRPAVIVSMMILVACAFFSPSPNVRWMSAFAMTS